MKLFAKITVIFVLVLLTTQQSVFAATTPTIQTINLGNNSTTIFNHSGFLSQSAGWSLPEAQGTWSVSSQAELNLSFPKFNKEAVVAFSSWGMVTQKNPVVTLTILVNSKTVGTYIYNFSYNKSVRLFDVPANVLMGNFRNVPVIFRITGNKSPFDLGLSSDKRNLGIYLEDVTLKYIN